MGKRTRRRARQGAEADDSGGPRPAAQQMARVNVDPDVWTAFRIEALRVNTSVAAYLGELVQREVDRLYRRDARPDGTGDRLLDHSQ